MPTCLSVFIWKCVGPIAVLPDSLGASVAALQGARGDALKIGSSLCRGRRANTQKDRRTLPHIIALRAGTALANGNSGTGSGARKARRSSKCCAASVRESLEALAVNVSRAPPGSRHRRICKCPETWSEPKRASTRGKHERTRLAPRAPRR